MESLTWDCSDEFEATSEQPISFLTDQSFISFPNWISRTGAIVSFKVKAFIMAIKRKATPGRKAHYLLYAVGAWESD